MVLMVPDQYKQTANGSSAIEVFVHHIDRRWETNSCSMKTKLQMMVHTAILKLIVMEPMNVRWEQHVPNLLLCTERIKSRGTHRFKRCWSDPRMSGQGRLAVTTKVIYSTFRSLKLTSTCASLLSTDNNGYTWNEKVSSDGGHVNEWKIWRLSSWDFRRWGVGE